MGLKLQALDTGLFQNHKWWDLEADVNLIALFDTF